MIDPPDDDNPLEEDCPTCGGSGDCPRCGGSGGGLEEDHVCSRCGGSGDCPGCDGTEWT